MPSPPDAAAHAAERVIGAVRQPGSRRAATVIVALDGPSGSGKSTLARMVAAWHARWDAAEAYYFTHVRPPSSFDLVVSTAPMPAHP